jgi:thioredoxin-like negative regulator of GroEL
VRNSEAPARASDQAARRPETVALEAKGRSNRLAARHALATALALAEKNDIDHALLEMLHALKIDSPEPDEEPFRRVVRANIAWSRQCARLRYPFVIQGPG